MMDNGFLLEIRAQLCTQMAQLLPNLRKSLKLSQTELGKAADISRQTISAAERGEYSLSWNQFASLYLVFDMNKASHEVLENNGLGLQSIAPILTVSVKEEKQDLPYCQ